MPHNITTRFTITLLRITHSQLSEFLKRTRRRDPPIRKRPIPNLPRALPRIPPKLSGSKIERMIRDPGIQMHAAAIIRRLDIVLHMAHLRIFTQEAIVIRRTRLLERTQRNTPPRNGEDILPQDPVPLCGSL